MKPASSAFPWTTTEIENKLSEAIRFYWTVKADQVQKQIDSGRVDAGDRGTVTGGKHLDKFCELLTELAQHAGYSNDEIHTNTGVTVAGFFRPMKKWDFLVIRKDRLCAAVEFKSMAGSYGNNLNNRAEEGLGSAMDFWRAYREGLLGTQQPFLGYFFIMCEENKSSRITRLVNPIFQLDPDFQNTSYVQRAEIMCRRLVLERTYTSAAYIVSPRQSTGMYREPALDLMVDTFLKQIYGHLIGCA